MIKYQNQVSEEYKTWPGPFREVLEFTKKFEVRLNDEKARALRPGALIRLREWLPGGYGYTGNYIGENA